MQDPSIYSQIKPQFPDQEHLKCPRCDSANTKFCYYNNYNLSQPRHFCKNCRRYWTKGGALRNIPVGGGSRKNTKRSSSSTKRSSSATSATSPTPSTSPPAAAATTSASSPPTPPATTAQSQMAPKTEPFGPSLQRPAPFDQDRRMMIDASGNNNYASLLSSNEGQYGNFYEGLNPNGSNLQLYGFGEHNLNLNPTGSGQHGGSSSGTGLGLQNNGNNSEEFINGGNNNGDSDSGIWNGTNGWPDLAIYTPGSNFQ